MHHNVLEKNETFRGVLNIVSGERVTLSAGIADATIIDDRRPLAPTLVTGYCFVVVWNPSSDNYGDITSYDLNFVIPGKNDVIVKGITIFHHPVGPEIGNNRGVMVQVRAHTASAVGRWSSLVSLGCAPN